MRVLVTGANGHLGVKLIRHLNRLSGAAVEVVALVRSARAAAALQAAKVRATIRIVDYRDHQSLGDAGAGCDYVVHLVGTIKESRDNSFKQAHEETCAALVAARLGAARIVCLGLLGTGEVGTGEVDTAPTNACFSSRARAEAILLAGPIPVTVIRLPMVLGENDFASGALARQASALCCFTFRAASLEQPIYSGDVVDAIVACLSTTPAGDMTGASSILDLAGLESLSREALIRRAGRCLGHQPSVISIPLWLGKLMAGLLERISSNPPVTRAMLGVLDHDDRIDPAPACQQLGLQLTPLDDMLTRIYHG